MNTYVLSRAAERDLEQIWDYVAKDNVAAADRLIERFFRTFDMLAHNSRIGHTRADLTRHPVLFWPVGNYLVIYRNKRKRVQVVGIVHGKRDIPTFLSKRR